MGVTLGVRETAHVEGMGYGSTIETITAEHAERLRTAPQTRHAFHGGYETFESRLLSAAISEWRSGDHDHNGDPDPGDDAVMLAPSASALTGDAFDAREHRRDTAYIVPVADPESVTTVTKTVKLTVPGDIASKLRARGNWWAPSEVHRLLEEMFPGTLGAYEIVSIPALRKPQAKATGGTAVTRYKVVASEKFYTDDEGVHEVFRQTHATQAEARAAAVALLTERAELPALGVEAVVGRLDEDGVFSKTLVVIDRPSAPEVTITVKVTTHTVAVKPKITEYKVMFMYHH